MADNDAIRDAIIDTGADVAARVVDMLYASPAPLDAIQPALEELGARFGAERAYIVEFTGEPELPQLTYEWSAAGDKAPKPRGLDLRGLLDAEGARVFRDADALAETQGAQGARVIILCGVKRPGGYSGYIRIELQNDVTDARLDGIMLAARLTATFLAKARAEVEASFSADFAAALDENASFIYLIDPASHEILYSNRAIREYSGSSLVGKQCFREFCGVQAPCAHCPIEESKRAGRSIPIEVKRFDGMWVLAQSSPLRWKGREIQMITSIDISRQKRADEASRIREVENAIMIAHSGKYVIRYDLKTHLFKRYYRPETVFAWTDEQLSTPEAALLNDFVAPESARAYATFFDSLNHGINNVSASLRLMSADRQYRWYRAYGTLVHGEGGVATHAILSVYDDTEAVEKELVYRKYKNRLMTLKHERAMYLEINLSANRIERADGLGDTWPPVGERDFQKYFSDMAEAGVFEADRARFLEFFQQDRLLTLYHAGVYEDEVEFRARCGISMRWINAKVETVRYPHLSEINAFIVFTDVDEARRETERLSRMALRDSLTGLYNHEATHSMITDALDSANPEDTNALFMIDLDNYKSVNDRLGHQRGDDTLKRVAAILAGAFRATDIVGRPGGDEFMVFMRGADTDSARARADKLVAELQIDIGALTLSASMGVAVTRGAEIKFEELYSLADKALYRAKRTGKNCYCMIEYGQSEDGEADAGISASPIKLNALLERLESCVVLCEATEDLKIKYFSPGAFHMPGCAHGRQARGEARALPEGLMPQTGSARDAIYRAAFLGVSSEAVYRARGEDGEIYWRQLRASRTQYTGSGDTRVMLIISDVTRLITRSAQLADEECV